MKVTATVERVGNWWAVEVDYAGGLHTQVKRLDQVATMVADAVALAAGVDPGDVQVTVSPVLPSEAAAHLAETRRAVARAAEAQREASTLTRQVVAELRDREGLSVRDVGVLLDVSPQRVSQLAKA